MDQIKFLNAVRKYASDLYQERIPEATKTNLEEIQGLIIEDSNLRNEFYDIMNKVARTIIHSRMFNNPLKEFKKDEIDYGNVIEEIGLDKIEAKVYDPNDQDVYKTNRPNMKALYNFENRKNVYDSTRNLAQLKGAFKGEAGLMNFANSFATNLESSAEIDEFLIMKEILKSSSYTEVNIPEIDGTPETINTFIEAVRKYTSALKYPSRNYNELGFLQHTPLKDLRLIVIEDLMNEIDLKVLASLFNKDLAQFKSETILVDNFNDDEDTYAILCDKDFLSFYDSLRTSREVENPRTLDITFILHIWSIIFTSKFCQAVKIRKEVEPTEASTSTPNVSLSVGQTTTFKVTTTPANASYSHYNFESADPEKVQVVSTDGDSCVLKVLSGSGQVVVTATNKEKSSLTATCTITIQ